jgi:DNA-binding transcriptional ArsR family regulator
MMIEGTMPAEKKRRSLSEKIMTREQSANQIIAVLDSDFFKALAEPVRVEILKLMLIQGPADISSISQHMPQDRSVLSRHLQILLRANLVSCEKRGRHRIYSVNGGRFVEQLETILQIVKSTVSFCCPSSE